MKLELGAAELYKATSNQYADYRMSSTRHWSFCLIGLCVFDGSGSRTSHNKASQN